MQCVLLDIAVVIEYDSRQGADRHKAVQTNVGDRIKFSSVCLIISGLIANILGDNNIAVGITPILIVKLRAMPRRAALLI